MVAGAVSGLCPGSATHTRTAETRASACIPGGVQVVRVKTEKICARVRVRARISFTTYPDYPDTPFFLLNNQGLNPVRVSKNYPDTTRTLKKRTLKESISYVKHSARAWAASRRAKGVFAHLFASYLIDLYG